MSTRAVYTFIDEDSRYAVYKHFDGYPRSAISFIKNAAPYAWELPRFEADDYAAAFIAANKETGGGDIRMATSAEAHGDLDYAYEIRCFNGILAVWVLTDRGDGYTHVIFKGSMQEFEKWIDAGGIEQDEAA